MNAVTFEPKLHNVITYSYKKLDFPYILSIVYSVETVLYSVYVIEILLIRRMSTDSNINYENAHL